MCEQESKFWVKKADFFFHVQETMELNKKEIC